MQLEFSRQIFKQCSIIIFHENPYNENWIVPCWQKNRWTETDIHTFIRTYIHTYITKLITVLSQFFQRAYTPFRSGHYFECKSQCHWRFKVQEADCCSIFPVEYTHIRVSRFHMVAVSEKLRHKIMCFSEYFWSVLMHMACKSSWNVQ
jgi:hypothetical protein